MVLRAGSAEDGPAVLASPLLRLHSSSAESEDDWPRPLSGEQLAQRPPSSERSESFTAPQETEAAVAEAEPENEAEVALTEADLAEETRKAAREMAQVARQFQITAVVESRRIMQLFFAKKFCQLDQPANIFSSAADAAEAIAAAPDAFGLVLANFADLRADGLEETAHALLAAQSDRPRMSLVAYDVSCFASTSAPSSGRRPSQWGRWFCGRVAQRTAPRSLPVRCSGCTAPRLRARTTGPGPCPASSWPSGRPRASVPKASRPPKRPRRPWQRPSRRTRPRWR